MKTELNRYLADKHPGSDQLSPLDETEKEEGQEEEQDKEAGGSAADMLANLMWMAKGGKGKRRGKGKKGWNDYWWQDGGKQGQGQEKGWWRRRRTRG